jgi:hypothetical protein
MSTIYNRYKIFFLSLPIIILCAVGGFFLYKNINTNTSPDNMAKKEATEIKKLLSKHLVLPEGEEPDIRKINQKLEDPFFANAEIGDYLIIFYKSRIAYTYSPERDLITNAGVVFVNPQQASSTDK